MIFNALPDQLCDPLALTGLLKDTLLLQLLRVECNNASQMFTQLSASARVCKYRNKFFSKIHFWHRWQATGHVETYSHSKTALNEDQKYRSAVL